MERKVKSGSFELIIFQRFIHLNVNNHYSYFWTEWFGVTSFNNILLNMKDNIVVEKSILQTKCFVLSIYFCLFFECSIKPMKFSTNVIFKFHFYLFNFFENKQILIYGGKSSCQQSPTNHCYICLSESFVFLFVEMKNLIGSCLFLFNANCI